MPTCNLMLDGLTTFTLKNPPIILISEEKLNSSFPTEEYSTKDGADLKMMDLDSEPLL